MSHTIYTPNIFDNLPVFAIEREYNKMVEEKLGKENYQKLRDLLYDIYDVVDDLRYNAKLPNIIPDTDGVQIEIDENTYIKYTFMPILYKAKSSNEASLA